MVRVYIIRNCKGLTEALHKNETKVSEYMPHTDDKHRLSIESFKLLLNEINKDKNYLI